ncbi:RNA polymerase sigma-70 factor [Pedobacter frigoris]|uniref:RNA polymerase sigma factor n=1 Tax=Pedobacter frigoris TaxID=2571272 RepID=UPI00292D434A|nr:RNA polymerase sigma-70 factor [Pedobacter frigoris]
MAAYSTYTDQELTALLREGDIAAFTEVYNRFFKVLFLHAVKRLHDEDDARDLVQELFSVLWVKRETAVVTTNLSNYLYTATRNGVFNFIARQKVGAKYLNSLPSEIDEATCITDHLTRERQLTIIIEREIAALPEKMRIVFELSRKEGLSHKQIAERLGISEETVKSQIKNALKQLRVKLGLMVYLIYIYF